MLQLGSLLELVSSCWFSRWSGSGVRWTWFLLIVLVGVSTSYDQIVAAASITFSERWRSFTKTFVPGPIGGKSIALCLLFNNVCYLCLLMLSLSRSFADWAVLFLAWNLESASAMYIYFFRKRAWSLESGIPSVAFWIAGSSVGVDPVCAFSEVVRGVYGQCPQRLMYSPPFLSAYIQSRWESSLSTWRRLVDRSYQSWRTTPPRP